MEFEKINTHELIEIYNQIQDFLNFLKKQEQEKSKENK